MEEAVTEEPVDATAATVAVTASEGVSVRCTGDGAEVPSAAQPGRIEDEAEPVAHGDNDAQTSACALGDGTTCISSACSAGAGDVCCSGAHSEQHKALGDDSADTRNYEVTYEHAPEDDDDSDEEDDDTCASRCHHHHRHSSNNNSDDTSTSAICDTKVRLQFIDVLLQADSHGLGLNIQVTERNSAVACSGGASLVVVSFRRLHPRDVGPAETTRQIQQGDLLHSVDGEVMRDLQHLHSTLQHKRTRSGRDDDAPFVLLRFLRPGSLVNESDSASTSSLTTEEEEEQQIETKPSSGSSTSSRKHDASHDAFEHWLENKHQVAILVRELATKNQELQEELVTSKLKLAEQSIQLEQLYALYAKTQLDNSPAFAISKSLRPFARRSSVSVASEKNGMGSPLGIVRKSTASSTKLQCEIEFAVQAEQERLRKHYQLQMDIEKRQVAARHQRELQTLKETMEKKLDMLEVGFREALKQQQEARVGNSIETCSCGTWMRLQQELYIHKSLDHDGEQESAECLVCSLLTDARRTSASYPNDKIDESSSSTSRKMQRVLDALREYDLLKQERTQSLDDAVVKPGRDDPQQP